MIVCWRWSGLRTTTTATSTSTQFRGTDVFPTGHLSRCWWSWSSLWSLWLWYFKIIMMLNFNPSLGKDSYQATSLIVNWHLLVLFPRHLFGMLTSWSWTLASHSTILRRSFRQASSKVKFLFLTPTSCCLSCTIYNNAIWLRSAYTDSGRAFAFKPDEPDLYLVGTGVNMKMFFLPLSSCTWFNPCTSTWLAQIQTWISLFITDS